MTITQYKGNNSLKLRLEFKWNNLDELINIPTKAEERFMIQLSLSSQDPNITTAKFRSQLQNSHLIYYPLYFQWLTLPN